MDTGNDGAVEVHEVVSAVRNIKRDESIVRAARYDGKRVTSPGGGGLEGFRSSLGVSELAALSKCNSCPLCASQRFSPGDCSDCGGMMQINARCVDEAPAVEEGRIPQGKTTALLYEKRKSV